MNAFAFALVLILQGLVVPGQNGVVTGQVRTREGAPAAGVRVVAQTAEIGGPSTDGAAFASLAETDAQGRYRLEAVPPGRYYIAAGLVSALSYYPGVATITEARTVTVTASPLTDVDFALARSAGVRVSGTVRGLPDNAPSNVRRVALSPLNIPGIRMADVAVQPGGKFEFSRVSPGSYNVLPSAFSTAMVRIEVGDRDIADIELKLPPVVMGRVVVEGGEKLPVQQAAIAAGVPDPPALMRLQARPLSVPTGQAPVVNGSFALILPAGEYQLNFPLLPLGYYVKSVTHGNVNLLESPLVVTEGITDELQVTLTRTPPAGAQPGVSVSGRVNGIPADGGTNPLWVTIQTSVISGGLSEQRVSETPVQPDGTFELRGVPPGSYTIRPNTGTTQTISVSSSGLNGVELQYTAPRTIVLSSILSVPPPPPPPPPPATIQISGKVIIVPGTARPGTIRLRSYALQEPPGGGRESPVNADGTFQFQGVQTGEFDLAVTDTAIAVRRNLTATQNITGIEVKVPVPAQGRVVVSGNSSVPLASLKIRNSYTEGETGGARSSTSMTRVFDIQSDGSFTLGIVLGEQNISLVNLLGSFSVKSITYGSVDLLSTPLRVTGPLTSEIVVTLEPIRN